MGKCNRCEHLEFCVREGNAIAYNYPEDEVAYTRGLGAKCKLEIDLVTEWLKKAADIDIINIPVSKEEFCCIWDKMGGNSKKQLLGLFGKYETIVECFCSIGVVS